MRIRFFDGTWSNIDDKVLKEMTTLSSMVAMTSQQPSTEQTTEIDLSTTITSFGVITAADFTAILVSRFSHCSISQLVQYMLMCNYLGWETKLPQLYKVVANKLCGATIRYKTIHNIRCNYMIVDAFNDTVNSVGSNSSVNNTVSDVINGNISDNTGDDITESVNNIKLLWRLRVSRYGQPDAVELKELQYVWWCMLADPSHVLKVLNISLNNIKTIVENDDTRDNVSELNRLENDNIKGVLWYCHQPLYFGPEAKDKMLWFGKQRNLKLITPLRRAAGIFDMFTSHEGGIYMDEEVMRALGGIEHKDIVEQYNGLIVCCSERHQSLLKLLYYMLVISWCTQVKRHFEGRAKDSCDCDPNFDPDLYMLRFPEPTESPHYIDAINPELEGSVDDLGAQVHALAEIIEISPPAAYERDLERLIAARKQAKVTQRGLAIRLKNQVLLRLKSDTQLQQLCQQLNILVVEYNRDLAIKVLSYYV